MGILDGRVALVTGSSRGIGAACAQLFAEHGAAVAVHGRDEAAVDEVRRSIKRAGGTAMGVVADLTDFDAVDALRAEVESELGGVDVLVANAGGSPVRPGPVEDISIEAWRTSIDVNLTATFYCFKSFLPGMKARGRGSIVTVSSASARHPMELSAFAYAAAKAGVVQLTKNVAQQAGPFGVRVNCIAPETILTETNLAKMPDGAVEAMALTHPLRRLGEPYDVAQAALYLASDASSWVSGVVLDVAGGAVIV